MKESLLTDIFWHAGFFLALSAIVIPALRYCKVPIALGYLLAGVVLGPYALGALVQQYPALDIISLKNTEHVKILAELGIILLLFVIGLEMTPRRLWQMRSLVFGLGSVQVITSALIIGGIAYAWGNGFSVAILLGLSLALSSTAIVTQWLHEQKLFVTHVGRTSFSILLLQDLAVIPILLMLTIMSTQINGPILNYISLSVLKMIGAAGLLYLGGRIILKPLFIFANRHGGSEVFMALSLLVIVTSASLASLAGLSMALGAFIAGLLLADTQYRHEIGSLITPFKSMLLGIFFISFGMSIDLHYIFEKPLWLIASVIGLMGIKCVIIFTLCKLWGQTNAVALESALLLAQAGEFGLLVVGSALKVGLMGEDVGQFMLIMIGITMILTPLLSPIARRLGRYLEQKSAESSAADTDTPQEQKTNHVVIFGYGRIGQAIADTLSEQGIEIMAFDKNVNNVHTGRAHGIPVFYGDASRKHSLAAANLDEALCAVIALNDIETAQRIMNTIRQTDNKLPIIVRTHNKHEFDLIQGSEHVHAIPEHIHLGHTISEKILEHCHIKQATPQQNQ